MPLIRIDPLTAAFTCLGNGLGRGRRRRSCRPACGPAITLPIDPGTNPSLPPTFWREHLPTLPDLGLVLMVLVLEAGLFRLFSRRGPERAFWLGFEVAGWAYVITCLAFAPVAWRLVYSPFEGYVLGRPMGSHVRYGTIHPLCGRPPSFDLPRSRLPRRHPGTEGLPAVAAVNQTSFRFTARLA